MRKLVRGLTALGVAGALSLGVGAPAANAIAGVGYYKAGTCRDTTTKTTYKSYKYKTTTRCTYITTLGVKIPNTVMDVSYWGRR